MAEEAFDRAASYRLGPDADECDMVMKGGITSGVVYPRAACRLARRYRFRRLGGSSAGAIAATMVAAAEHGRDRAGAGFARLDELPDELGTALPLLFQPSEGTSRAFDLLTTWIDPDLGRGRRVRRSVRVVSPWAPWWGVLAALAVVALLATPRVATHGTGWGLLGGLAPWLPAALLVALLVAAVVVVIDTVRLVPRTLAALEGNGFGLCDGHTRRPGVALPPLTDWMTDVLDQLAGRATGPEAPPLTFGDLWGESATAAYRAAMADLATGEAAALTPNERRALAGGRTVDVVVMTTDLPHRRPYRFPFDTQVFLWCPACLERYLPARVMAQLRRTGRPTDPEDDPGEAPGVVARLCPLHGDRLWLLPLAPDIPVVLAARLSLSFPGLISAVPLYAVDFATVPGAYAVKATWFSDGGITSNFPMQFFDQPWPTRPTFGINLMPLHPDSPDLVWRATQAPTSGTLPRHRPVTSMFGFLHAIVDTMQNWVDNLQVTMRGFHDRVAEVRQREDEGGMNLEMRPETIRALADRGTDAAALFDRFSFDDHRGIRYRVAMGALDEMLSGMEDAYHGPGGYEELVADPGLEIPAVLREQGEQLVDVAGQWRQDGNPAQQRSPRPRPQLRLVPRQ